MNVLNPICRSIFALPAFLLPIVCLFFSVAPLYSQEQADTVPVQSSPQTPVLLSAPVRVYTHFETGTNTGYRLKYNDKTYEKGKIRDFSKAKLGLSVPVLKGKFYHVSMAGHYGYYHLNFDQEEVFSEKYVMDMKSYHQTWQVATNGVFYGKLFNKLLISNLHFSVDGSGEGFEKFSGRAVAVLQMKRTPATSLGLGVLVLINSTIPVPVFPVVTYRQAFNPQWSLDMALPQVQLKYAPNKKHSFVVGMDIDNDYFYVHSGKEFLPDVYVFSKVLLKPGLTYAYSISKQFHFTVSGGASLLLSGRMYDKKHPKEYIRITQPTGTYANVGLSYNIPFL